MANEILANAVHNPAHHDDSVECAWKPFLPEPPNPECSILRAIVFGHRWTSHIKWILAGLLTVALQLGGIKSPVLIAASEVFTLILCAVSIVQVVRDARRCVRRQYAVPVLGHAQAREFLQRMHEHGIGLLLHCMSEGGNSRTVVFENPPSGPLTPVEDWSRPASRICTGPSLQALIEYWSAREELCWEAAQLPMFKKWAARGARPCAPRLHRWLEEHGHRNEVFTAFVRELASLAAESDGPLEQRRQADAEADKQARARWKAEEAERAARPRQVVYPPYVGSARDREAEYAAENRFRSAMDQLRARVVAMAEASEDFRARDEHWQLQSVENELSRLRRLLSDHEFMESITVRRIS